MVIIFTLFQCQKGISEKHICDYEIYLPDIRTKNNIDDISKEISLESTYLTDLTIKGKYILRGMLETGSKKCIIYLRNQEEAIQMVTILDKLNEYYFIDLYSESIISDNSSNSRNEILNKFSTFDGYAILCSVAILDECIDIPQCDSIFISYPSESKIRNIQRLSRANRKDKNNIHKISKVFLWCDEYNEISVFISQLKEFDENFREDKVCIMNIDGNKGGILERNKKDYEGLYKKLDDIIVSIRKFGYGIDSWKKNLQELKEFIKKYNKLPSIKVDCEKYLSHWIYDQNHHFKKNIDIMKLPEIQKLWKDFVSENKSLFVLPNEIWSKRLEDLEQFITNNNRLPSQASSEDHEDISLAKWIVRNNDEYVKNEKAMKDPIIRNEWNDFKNKYSNLFDEKLNVWNDKLNLVMIFIEKNSRLPYENKSKKEEYDLRIWLKTQEKIYNKNKFENDNNKRINFEKVLFTHKNLFSKVSNFELWNDKYEEFVQYIEKNNQLPKEKFKNPDNDESKKEIYESLKSLGVWKSNQVQYSKINFSTVIPDIDISKLSPSEKEKHQKRLDKYNTEIQSDNEILLKNYSVLNKKDKLQYDKIKLKVDERNKNFEEERNESSEKLRLWNEIKDRFPKLF